MAYFELAVPGYAAVPERGGPDVFRNVGFIGGPEFAWTDQAGWRRESDVLFFGEPGVVMDFHFPFTTPVIFGTAAAFGATRMRVSAVFVTFFLRATVPPSDARVNRIRVVDRLTRLFDTAPIFGLLGMPTVPTDPPAGYINSTVSGRNLHTFAPIPITKSIGVTVTVNFGAGGGHIAFTGAGVRLE